MTEVFLRLVRPDDLDLMWGWRNDPHTRRMERVHHMIPRDFYHNWVWHALTSSSRRIYLAEAEGCAIGYSELSLRRDGGADMGINFNPAFRGRGLAGTVIRGAIAAARPELGFDAVWAEIRNQNVPSQRAFARAGFSLWRQGEETLHMVRSEQLDHPAVFRERVSPQVGAGQAGAALG
ncbi:GNAT family N-acetyltransferase [Govanella unica]|uniref:GNAT family N-acetyltransferase n=1 Tax=Govanella unica TaxID=2975056 RepID=A0A9X3TZK6_9PROT|nr:GNAT family N-acetyltransferase [Govania unica]MDA5194665.1 GNAT family N-acetyltransferase [Govania unica]